MGFNYDNLWKIMIDKKMKKIDLQNELNLSPTTVARLGRNENVSMNVLGRICDYFECDICDILTYRHEEV
jgi:DNA-binding Xre family transcriptional regulator